MLLRVVDLFKSKDRVLPEDSSRLHHQAREFSLVVCINKTISFETNTRSGRKGFN